MGKIEGKIERVRFAEGKGTVSTIVALIDNGAIMLKPPSSSGLRSFQRSLVWSDKEKKLLLDSIVKDFDIGKFLFREVKDKGHEYEVIDGQQRLDTLRRLKHGDLTFSPETGPEFADKKLGELPSELQVDMLGYALDIVILKNISENQEREMFRRLQLGRRLTNGERLKASYGELHDFIEKKILEHKLFEERRVGKRKSGVLLGFSNSRDVYFEVASQIVRLGFEGQACAIEYKNLEEMYFQNLDKMDDSRGKEVIKDLNFYQGVLEKEGAIFHPDKANCVSLYLFISTLRKAYTAKQEDIMKFIRVFEAERRATSLTDPELVEYNKRLAGGTGKRRSLQFRFETLIKRFLAKNPKVGLLDDKRVLSPEQRLAVYWRDKGVCRACHTQVSDKDFEVHHTDAWKDGGPTTVENSLPVCQSCHHKITSGQLKL